VDRYADEALGPDLGLAATSTQASGAVPAAHHPTSALMSPAFGREDILFPSWLTLLVDYGRGAFLTGV
jgi:hypothetical protein